MFHQLCYDIDGSLLCANTIESHQVGMLKPSTWCKRKEVYEVACVCVHVCIRTWVHACMCVHVHV